jgi:hypothetical protein
MHLALARQCCNLPSESAESTEIPRFTQHACSIPNRPTFSRAGLILGVVKAERSPVPRTLPVPNLLGPDKRLAKYECAIQAGEVDLQ